MPKSATQTTPISGKTTAGKTSPADQSRSLEMEVHHRTTPALLMSIAAHVVLLVLIGVVFSTAPKGTGGEVDRPVGIALVHRLPDRDRYVEAEPQPDSDPTADSQSSSSAAASAPPADQSPPIDLAGILQAMAETPSTTSGTGLAGETSLDGDAFGDGTGRAGKSATGDDDTAMVFGVTGSGSRFVYVFDRSDSMNGYGGRPLRSAKAELIRSLRSLTPRQQFQIIFYNDTPKPFEVSGLSLQMVTGESSLVERAESYVQSIRAFGGTKHETALKLALRMSPDVIFFLTDARIPRLSGSALAEIKRRAERSGTTIHAIEFGSDPGAPASSFLRDLASQNSGQYQYIDVRQLSEKQLRPLPENSP